MLWTEFRRAPDGPVAETVPGSPRIVPIGDPDEWSRLLAELPEGELEQGWEWAEVLRGSGARPLRYAVKDRDGQCLGVVSFLAWVARPFSFSLLDAPRGPALLADREGAWAGVVMAAREAAARTGAVFARVSPPVPADRGGIHEALVRHGFVALPDAWTQWNPPRIVMTLNLDGSDEHVWRGISNRRRREIRHAARAGVEIVDGGGADVGQLHRLLLEMGRLKRYPVRRATHLEALYREYVARGGGVFRLARLNGRLVGGLIGCRLGRRAYLLHGVARRGLAPRDGGVRAGPLLYWDFIRWASAGGCRTVHWGGSGTHLPPRAQDPGYGLFQFKRSFGSSCWAYAGYYDLVFRPRLYAVLRTAERLLGPLSWRLRSRLNH